MKKNKRFPWEPIKIGILLVCVVLLGYIAIYGKLFTFNITQENPQISLNPEKIKDSYFVTLEVVPNTICVGQSATGKISSDIPNGRCSIYYDNGNGMIHLRSIQLDSIGMFQYTQPISVTGTVRFRTVCCDSNSMCKISNDATLNVNICATSQATTTLPSVHYDCFDSDNGIDFDTLGFCQDSYHQLGYQELCFNGQVKEYYCDSMGICQITYGGTCTDAWQNTGYPCTQIFNPPSQQTCSMGHCDSGTCSFVPPQTGLASQCVCS